MRKNIYIPIDTMIIHDLHINKLVKRGDALTLKIRIFENGVAKELGGQAVDVILKKVDGTNLEKSLDSVTGSDLNIDFSNQATNVSGELKGEIQIYDSTGQSSTNTFMLVVQDSLADDVLDKSVDDIQVLTDLKNLINENKKILEEYKEELLQIAGTTEAVNALIQIQALIDDTLPQLIEQNQLALANINSLDNKNTLAATNISTLEDLNTQAQLLIDQLKSLIEANSVAEKNLTDLTALNQISAGLKNNLTSLNNTATTLKEDLTNLISQGDTVYNTLHDEVVLADEKIKTMQSFDPESVLPDVTELKQEVHDARGTYPSLNDRITNIIGGEDATKVYIGDTEPEYDGVWFDTSADGTEDPTPGNSIVTAFKKYVEDEVLTQLPNPNLLINGDFQVWQRGTFFGGYYPIPGVSIKLYTADRWRYDVEGSDKGDVHKYEDGGLCFKLMSDKRFWFVQHIELTKELIYSIRQNGYLTVSFDIFSHVELNPKVRLFAGTLTNIESSVLEKSFTCNSTNKRVSVTFKIENNMLNNSGILTLDIFRLDDTNKKVIDGDKFVVIRNVKLELGDKATPFISRPYGGELALCQRYYEKGPWRGISLRSFNTTDFVQNFIPYEVSKRITPTINIFSNLDSIEGCLQDTTNNKNIAVNVGITGLGGFTLRSENLTKDHLYIGTYTADAEIY